MSQLWATLPSSISEVTLSDTDDLPYIGRGLHYSSSTNAHELVTVHDLRGNAVTLRLGRGQIHWFNFQRVLVTGTAAITWVAFHD
jgi:hypothetical protein